MEGSGMRGYNLTKEQESFIKDNWIKMTRKEISEKLSLHKESLTRIARRLGLTKKYNTKETDEFKSYFFEHYADTTDSDLAKALGCNISTICVYAKKYGLKKSDEFWKEQYRRAGNASIAWQKMHPEYSPAKNLIPYRITIGVKALVGEERWKECCKKGAETRHKIYEAEKRRINWGLSQKTNLRVVGDCQRQKNQMTYRLRCAGYTLIEHNIYLRPTNWQEHKRLENNATKKYSIKFIDNE